MGCCCSRSKRSKQDTAATTSSELTSSISSLPSGHFKADLQASLKPDARALSEEKLQPQPVGAQPAVVPASQNGIPTAHSADASAQDAQGFLRCPSGILFEDDMFFDAQEELQWEASHQPQRPQGLDVIFNRYENWMRQSMEGQTELSREGTPQPGSSFTQLQPVSPMSHRGEGLWPEANAAFAPMNGAAAADPLGLQHSMDGSRPLVVDESTPSFDSQQMGASFASEHRRSSRGGSMDGSSFRLRKAKQRKLAKQLHEAYSEGRCLAAEGKLQELRANTDIEGPQLASAAGLSTEALAALPGRAKEYQAAVADIRNDVGWDVARDNALRALHRHEKGTMIHSFKLSATFEHELDRLVALAREIDLVHILEDRLTGQILEQPSLFNGTFNIHVKTPWPFPRDLDLTLYACGADLSQEHQCMVILLKDSPVEMTPEQKPASSKQQPTARLSVLPGSAIMLRPVNAKPGATNSSSTQGFLMVHLTMDLASVPSLWIRLLLRVTAPWLHRLISKGLVKAFAHEGTLMEKRIAERPELYQLVKKRLHATHGKLW